MSSSFHLFLFSQLLSLNIKRKDHKEYGRVCDNIQYPLIFFLYFFGIEKKQKQGTKSDTSSFPPYP